VEESAIVIRTAREHFTELLCAGYILLGLVWLFFTERLLASVTHDPRLFERLHVLSWLVFMVVSAALAYALIIKARANEARLQDQLAKIAASSPSVICSFRMGPDSTFSFPYASPAIEEIYGVPPQALVSDASVIESMVPANDVERVKASLRASADAMSPWRAAWRVRHPTKGELWIEGSAMPVRETDDSVLWHGVITDITARMTAEQSLRESETRYRTLFNAGRDAFFVFPIDEKGMPLNFTQVNDETCRMFGYTREELMRMSPADVVGQDSRAEMPELGAVLLREGHFRREVDHVTKDGRHVPGEVTVTLFEIQGQRTGMAIVRDMSEHKSAEESLRKSTERLRLIARSVREVFFIAAPDFSKVHYVNEAFERLFGIPSERLVTEPMAWMNAIHPGDHEAIRAVIAGLVQGVSEEIEFRIVRPDGAERWLWARPQLIDAGDGKSLAIGIVEDITERRMSEEARLREAYRQRDALVREVHHRIKNNLQGVAGLLQQQAMQNPEIAGPIDKAIGRMQTVAVVYGLQGAAGYGQITLRDMLAAITRGVEELTGAHIALRPGGRTVPPLRIRESEAVPLALAVNELVVNAVKHSSEPQPCGIAGVEISLTETPERAVITIRNPGTLPAGFEFDYPGSTGVGLGLVRTLLPRNSGVDVTLTSDHASVTVTIRIGEPALLLAADG
jgi:PAS domain S-box-containing protein